MRTNIRNYVVVVEISSGVLALTSIERAKLDLQPNREATFCKYSFVATVKSASSYFFHKL